MGGKRPGTGLQPATDPKKTPQVDKKTPGVTGPTGRVSTGLDKDKNPKNPRPKTETG